MEVARHVVVPGPLERVFALVDDLAAYPTWMDLVHDVVEVDSPGADRAWDVELQAQVGPFARSKRLRMVRVVHDPAREVVFERAEIDGRRHSPWVLRAVLVPALDRRVELAMTLHYGGSLWTGAVLQRVLDDHVGRGTAALLDLLAAEAVEPDSPA